MQYSFNNKNIRLCDPVAACIFADSYLKEDVSEKPYNYSRDPVLNTFIQGALYFRVGTELDNLKRIEDKIVVDYIPVIPPEPFATEG